MVQEVFRDVRIAFELEHKVGRRSKKKKTFLSGKQMCQWHGGKKEPSVLGGLL